ncbi:ATP synthase F1 subunit gamma [Amedibacillus sp. YH-ame10]
MAAGKLAIKARIRSVESTQKITKAMQLVASSKLKKQKQYMEENREYAYYLKETVQEILSTIENNDHPFLTQREGKTCTIVFTSDMGLCGGYNANVYRMLEESHDDDIVMIGGRGNGWIRNKDFKVVQSLVEMEDDCYQELSALADSVLENYRNGEIASIQILYTRFVNPVTFTPEIVKLLPVQKEERVSEKTGAKAITEFEPAGDKILNTLIPLYLRSLLYSYFLETKTSEQASRRMAMESATDNADELKETLELEFNQARQAAITQEITEIVGGVNAMEGANT